MSRKRTAARNVAPRIPRQQHRWDQATGEFQVLQFISPFEYSEVDPDTGATVCFDTRQQRDAWRKKHNLVAS